MKKVIYAGFGKLGYVCLQELVQRGMQIEFVLTHKSGLEHSVDGYCLHHNIKFSYSDLRKDQILLENLKSSSVEYLISVNYRYIIPGSLLNLVKYPLNLHGSLLPKYRGRTPHVWAIINGETKAGISCHIMEETVDTGDIYEQVEIDITPNDTGATLVEKFESNYPLCLRETLNKIDSNFVPIKQDNEQSTYFGKRIPEMGYIDFTKDRLSIINFIRAQAKPYPGAYCYLPDGKKIIVHRAEIVEIVGFEPLSLGSIRKNQEGFLASAKDGLLLFSDYEIV